MVRVLLIYEVYGGRNVMDKYSIMKEKDLFIVQPEGDIACRSYPEFEKKLVGNLKLGGKAVFNMEKVDFIDSQGVVFLIRMRELVEANGGCFSIYNLKHNVEKVLRRLQLEKVLNVTRNAEKCFIKFGEFEDDRGIIAASR